MHLSHFYSNFFTQTLNEILFMSCNIDTEAAKHLADAFQNNNVKNVFLFSYFSCLSSLFQTETQQNYSDVQYNHGRSG